MKICLINQPAGLGDIFYTQRIAHHFRSLGYDILFPVIKQYKWLADYMDSEGISFFSEETSFAGKELYCTRLNEPIISDTFCYLPLRYASHNVKTSRCQLLEAKYELVGLLSEASSWADSFSFKRNLKRECELYYDVLGLKDGEDFIFSNRWIGSPDGNRSFLDHVKFDSRDIKVVEHDMFGDFTLFDWSMVLERAVQIHTPNTAFCFLIDALVTVAKSENKFMYPRDNCCNINDNWDYMRNSLDSSKWTLKGKQV